VRRKYVKYAIVRFFNNIKPKSNRKRGREERRR
jgi:hypothetical protein